MIVCVSFDDTLPKRCPPVPIHDYTMSPSPPHQGARRSARPLPLTPSLSHSVGPQSRTQAPSKAFAASWEPTNVHAHSAT